MKTFSISCFLAFSIITSIFAQLDEPMCVAQQQVTYNGQLGGYLLPSVGTIRVFIVFVQFPDDNYDTTNTYWIKGQAPANMNYWVNQTWTSSPIQGSLTHYFNVMSFNNLKFIGRRVSVTTPHTRQWYLDNNKRRGDIHKEVIQQLDVTWDFAQFDTWDLDSVYQHTNTPDGIVEMIMMVWRNIGKEYPDSLQEDLYRDLNFEHSFGSLGGSSFKIDNDARTVKTGFWASGSTPGGSGVTITDHLLQRNLQTPIHEFAHYLLGGNNYHVGYGFWGMLEAFGRKSKVANSFERYRLGWINIVEVDSSPNQTISNATLSDYATTGISYRLNINPSTHEFFYLENHQKLSYWEQNIPPSHWDNNSLVFGNVENGLYVIRQSGFVGSSVQIVPADGRFNWTVNQKIQSPWGSELLPVYKNLGADRDNGYHDLEYIPWTWNGINQTPQPIHFTENASGNPVQDVRYPGDGKDAFREGFNEVFSPWSNPNSQKANRTSTPFGFKINSFSSGVCTLDIYVNTAINAPPSKPQNLAVTVHYTEDNSHPKLTWTGAGESDVLASNPGYLIERKINYSSFSQVATLNGTATEFIDYGINYAGSGAHTAYYRIRAKDTQGLISVYSDVNSIKYGNAWKEVAGAQEEILKYQLKQNFPNPFNPTTRINYTLAEDAKIQIKVYDMLGTEVAELVNEMKPAGYYEATFDGYGLSSGIYIYKITAMNGERILFSQSKQMILLK
jgi:M6 family metalloprotease-like protein